MSYYQQPSPSYSYGPPPPRRKVYKSTTDTENRSKMLIFLGIFIIFVIGLVFWAFYASQPDEQDYQEDHHTSNQTDYIHDTGPVDSSMSYGDSHSSNFEYNSYS